MTIVFAVGKCVRGEVIFTKKLGGLDGKRI